MDDIYTIIRRNSLLQLYLPDNFNLKHLPRKFLLSLIFQKDRASFQELEYAVKIRQETNRMKHLDECVVDVDKELIKEIEKLPDVTVLTII